VKLKMVDAVKSKCWMRTSALLAYLSRDLPIPLILVSKKNGMSRSFGPERDYSHEKVGRITS
jgi:hypothetical protein